MRYNIASALVADLQDNERAVEVMQPYLEQTLSTAQIKHADVEPDLDSIREDSRFKALVAAAKDRLGITAKAGG